MKFFRQLMQFIKAVSEDPRIPDRDKKLLLILAALIVSPIDLIPDWIPFLGVLDDIILIAIVLDYFFSILETDLVLSHYPWGFRSFLTLKRASRIITYFVPSAVKNKIWKYKRSPYE
jgi:uncharacterized membrane protein YkvA (DUF1232 family)